MLPVNAASLALLTSWREMFEGSVWWWGILVLRNVLFILLGLYLGSSATVDDVSLTGADRPRVPGTEFREADV